MLHSSSSTQYGGHSSSSRASARPGKNTFPSKAGSARSNFTSDNVSWLSKDELLPPGLSFQDYKNQYNVSSQQVDLLVLLISDLFREGSRDKMSQLVSSSIDAVKKWCGPAENPAPIFNRVYSGLRKDSQHIWLNAFRAHAEGGLMDAVAPSPSERAAFARGGTPFRSKLCDDVLEPPEDPDQPARPQVHDHIGAGLQGQTDVLESVTAGLAAIRVKIHNSPDRGPVSGAKLVGRSVDLQPEASAASNVPLLPYATLQCLPYQQCKSVFTQSAQTLSAVCGEIANSAGAAPVAHTLNKKTDPVLTHVICAVLGPALPKDMTQRCVLLANLLSCSSVKAADTLMICLPALLAYNTDLSSNSTAITTNHKELPTLFLQNPIPGYAYARLTNTAVQEVAQSSKSSRQNVLLCSIYHYAQELSAQRQSVQSQNNLQKQNTVVQMQLLKTIGENDLEIFQSNGQEHLIPKSLHRVLHASLAQLHTAYPLEARSLYGDLGKPQSTVPAAIYDNPGELYYMSSLGLELAQVEVQFIPPASLLPLLAITKEVQIETVKSIGLALNGRAVLSNLSTSSAIIMKRYSERNLVYMLFSTMASTKAHSRSLVAFLFPLLKNIITQQSIGFVDKHKESPSDAKYLARIMQEKTLNGLELFETARRLTSGVMGIHHLFPQTKLYASVVKVLEQHKLDRSICSVTCQAFKDAGLGGFRSGVYHPTLPLPQEDLQEHLYGTSSAISQTEIGIENSTLASFILPSDKAIHAFAPMLNSTHKGSSQPVYMLPKDTKVFIIDDDLKLAEAWTAIQPYLPVFSEVERSLYSLDSQQHADLMDGQWQSQQDILKKSMLDSPISMDSLQQSGDLQDQQSVAAHSQARSVGTTWRHINDQYSIINEPKTTLLKEFPCIIGIDVENSPGNPPGPAQWLQLSVNGVVLLLDLEKTTHLTMFFMKYIFMHPQILKVGVSTWDDVAELIDRFPACNELKSTRSVLCFGELQRTIHTLEKQHSTTQLGGNSQPIIVNSSDNPSTPLEDVEIADPTNMGGSLFHIPTHRAATGEQARFFEQMATAVQEKSTLSSLHTIGQHIVPMSLNTLEQAFATPASSLGALCFQQSRLPNIHAMGLKALTARFTGKQLNKDEQMSSWDSRPLSPSQIAYAAIDAHVSPVIMSSVLKKYKQSHLETAMRWLLLGRRL